MEFILTCQEHNRKLTIYEFQLYDKTFEFKEWLDDEVGLAHTDLKIEELVELIINKPIIFIRHIFKIDVIFDRNNEEHYIDGILKLCHQELALDSTFSIQMRCSKKAYQRTKGIPAFIAGELNKYNYKLDVKKSEQIVSIYMSADFVYAGISLSVHNISHWNGGAPHYSPTSEFNFISRAEYKLLDTAECFGIDFIKMKTGLDLGAALGGWTKVLTDYNIKTASVDPHKLDSKIAKRKKVRYYQMTAEQYLKMNFEAKYDIILNDMKIDVDRSIKILISFQEKLNESGLVVTTFKLPHQFAYKSILANINSLTSAGYKLVGAKQLFHNRSEITVVLK